MRITIESVVVASKDQLSSSIGRDTVIAGLRKGNYYGLSSVGARVWQLLQEPALARDLRRTIADEYDIATDRCEADLLALLECMAREGLIDVCAR